MALPSGWHTTTWDDGDVIDPLTRVVIASAPIEPEETACQVAHYRFAEDAVALVVLEWSEPLQTLPDRPARFTSRELPVQSPPAIECFDGSGGTVQFIDHGRAFGAYLLVGRQAPARLLDEARDVLDTLKVEPHRETVAQRLTRNGISVLAPTGWSGRILFREATGRDGAIFQIANFELPSNAGLEPPVELPPGQEDQIKAMDAGDILVTIADGVADGVAAPKTITVDHLAPADNRAPHGHSLAERSFCFESRCVGVAVDFGRAAPAAVEVTSANEVLASLVVAK